tara:strand:+ start:1842 stop:2360 length:519 start_codon:yes stop_codon:yes gene_type:complete
MGTRIITNTNIIPKNFQIVFFPLNLTKNIIEKGIINSIASYRTSDAHAIQTNVRNNETFVLLRNNAIADTNKKKNNEKLIPSNDISNSLGSTANRKHPNIANLILTNLLKIKKAGIIVNEDKTILKDLCICIKCRGCEVSENIKNNDKKFDHPVLVTVYPTGKLSSKTVFTA